MSRFAANFKAPSAKEAAAAKARLARTDTVSLASMGLESRAPGDKSDAIAALKKQFGLTDEEASKALDKMVDLIRRSDFTINFNCTKWFGKAVKGGYQNNWERGIDHHNTIRDSVEESMFGYTGASKNAPKGVDKAVMERVETFGSQKSGDFEGVTRPRYAGVNFSGRKTGAAPNWGKSYLVVAEHVKHNSTLVPLDSFSAKESQLKGMLADFHNVSRLIVSMLPDLRKKVFDKAVQGSCAEPSETDYIEAHLHADVDFKRDVARLVINSTELNASGDVATCKKNLEKFQREHGVTIEYS